MPIRALAGDKGHCGRVAGHPGRCVDARVIAMWGYCEQHDWCGDDCPKCQRERVGA
jgi:hypothetical protein